MAMRLCGYVAMFQKSQKQSLDFPKFHFQSFKRSNAQIWIPKKRKVEIKIKNLQDSSIPKLKHVWFAKYHFPRIIFLQKGFGDSYICDFAFSNPQIRVPLVPKDPTIMQIEVFGLSHNKIEKLLMQNEA